MSNSSNTLHLNLPVSSLPSSIAFYTSLGFVQNHKFSNDQAAMLSLSPSVTPTPVDLMLLTQDFFKSLLEERRQLCDAKRIAQVLVCVDMPGRERIDSMLEKVKAAKGEVGVTKAMEMPGMYGGSFADLDGHIFELICMEGECPC